MACTHCVCSFWCVVSTFNMKNHRYSEPVRTRPDTDIGLLTIVTNEAGQCVAVTRTDEEHRILDVIWEAPKAAPPIPEEGTRWLHVSGEATYTVILVTSKPEEDKADKFPRSVVYRGDDGRTWTRTLDSWYKSFTPL
jgi:hypothetical protein